MAQTIKAEITAYAVVYLKAADDLATGQQVIKIGSLSPIEVEDGTADGQANRVYADRDTSGSAQTYDLYDFGGATDGDGAYTLANVKGIFLKNNDSTADLTVTKGDTNGWTGLGTTYTITIAPGGIFQWWNGDGVTVTDASSHTFKVDPNSGTGGFDLVVIGEQ